MEALRQVGQLMDDEAPRVLEVLDLSRLSPGETTSPTGFHVIAWADDAPFGHAHLALTDA